MPRSRRPVQSTDHSNAADQKGASAAGGAGNQAASGGKSGGVMGWLRGAGQWMGDKVKGATDAVGDWANDTKEWAQDAWEVGTSTDIGMENGTVYLETDLDELSDLMSAETRAALALDRATADNRVRIAYNYDTGALTATSDEIALAGFQADKVQAGQVLLRNVRAVFTDQSKGERKLGGAFDLFQYKKAMRNLQVVVTIGSAQATDVRFTGPNGPSSVDSVALEGLQGTVGSSGGLPFSEAGTTEVDFALQHAVLEGLAAEGHTVASAELSDVTAGMSGSNESAFLAAESLAVSGVAGENSAGNAQMTGLRVDVDNKGGGLLGADGKADAAKARVAVEAASVSDLDTKAVDAQSFSAAGLNGTYDTTTGMGGASLGRVTASGLDTSWVDANQIEARGLAFDGDLAGRDGRRNADLDVKSLTGDGVSVVPTTDGKTAAGGGGKALDWSADLASIDLTNTHAGGADISHAAFNGTSVRGSVDGDESALHANVTDASLSGFSHAAMRADQLTTRNTTLTADATSMNALADHVKGTGIETQSLRAGELNAYGGSASIGGGHASASLDRARLNDATIADRYNLSSAQVDHLSASRSGDRSGLSFTTASAEGLHDTQTGARIGAASLDMGAAEFDSAKGSVTGSVGKGTIANASGLGGTLDSAAVDTIHFAHSPGGGNISAQTANVSGLQYGQTRLEAGTLTGLSGERNGQTDTMAADSLALTGLAHGNASMASASANRLSGTRDAEGIRGGVGSLSAQDIKVGDTASVANAYAHGLAVSKADTGLNASVTEAMLEDSQFATNQMNGSLSSAVIKAGALSRNDGGLTTGAESVRLKGLDAKGTMGGGRSGGGGGGSSFDTARAIETTAANIEDAEISAGMNLRGGKLGIAGLKAKPNTRVDASVSIRDGKVQDEGTGVDLSQPVNGPLWTALRGGYMQDGKLKANIRGWADMDVTEKVNAEMGVTGDTIPDVATIGAGVAHDMRSAEGKPKKTGEPSALARQLDKETLTVDANAQLGSGVIDTGSAQIDLGRAQESGDNRIDASVRDGSLEAEIQRFLADSARYSAGGTTASAGPTSASGVKLNASESDWSLHADELNATDVRGSRQ